jgi:hypothetical protein
MDAKFDLSVRHVRQGVQLLRVFSHDQRGNRGIERILAGSRTLA